MGSAKNEAMRKADLRSEVVHFLVRIEAIRECRHDVAVGGNESKESMAYAMATNEAKTGRVDASLEEYRAMVSTALSEAKRGFCASCDKERRDT